MTDFRKGLITNDRGDKLAQHKIYFSRDDNGGQQFKTLSQVVEYVKPTILMGLSTIRGIFDESILKRMAQLNEQPIIFPLSNPSSNAECTFEEAVKHTDGKVIFASGSPFEPYVYKEKTFHPSQGKYVNFHPFISSDHTNESPATCMSSQVSVSAVSFAKPNTSVKKW